MGVRFKDDRLYTRAEVRAFGFNVCGMQFLRWEAKGLPPRKANGDRSARVYYKGSDLNDFFGL